MEDEIFDMGEFDRHEKKAHDLALLYSSITDDELSDVVILMALSKMMRAIYISNKCTLKEAKNCLDALLELYEDDIEYFNDPRNSLV